MTMDMSSQRQRAGEQTFELILTTAEELIHERGFSEVSLRELAQAVGVKAASLYYHFPSKEEMLFAIAMRHMDSLLAATCGSIERLAEDAHVERLTQLVHASVLYHIEHMNAAGVVINERRHLNGENDDALLRKFREYESIFVGVIERGQRAGAFRGDDAVMAAFVMLGAITRLPVWYKPGGRLTPPQVAEAYTHHLLWAVGAEPRFAA